MVIGVATFDSRLIAFLRCWPIMAEKRCVEMWRDSGIVKRQLVPNVT